MEKVLVSGRPRLWAHMVGRFIYCPGCQHPTVERLLAEVIEEMGIEGRAVGIAGVGCHARLMMPLDIDSMQSLHGRATDVATGIKRALRGRPVVFTVQGDGDCGSIGAGGLIGAVSRGERITVVMLNNTNYGTTGGQMAPTTLLGQVTPTTPEGREAGTHGYPLHLAELLATMRSVAYAARGALNSPANYQRTKRYLRKAFQKQLDNAGFSFVEILLACPVNWHLTPVEAMKRIEDELVPEFPLGEFKE